jgi:hypothetical protein
MEDDLLLNYFQFKNNINENPKLTQKLFTYYKPFLTNISQLERIEKKSQLNKIEFGDDALKEQLLGGGYINQTIEELAKDTSLKIILSNLKDTYPYVNINNDKIEVNYTGTFKKNEPRTKCIAHLKELCINAKNILICDNYLGKKISLLERVLDLFPNNISINYEFKNCPLGPKIVLKLMAKKSLTEMTANQDTKYKNLHDRYLLIDSKIEVILTSGFDYLFNDNKELTYIVRQIK